MGWGKQEDVRAIIRAEVDAYMVDYIDQKLQDRLNLTPAQRLLLQNLLTDLDAGTATTLQHQRATAKLIRMAIREP